jgi:hypothetical protein
VPPLLPWIQEVVRDDTLHLDLDDETWGPTSWLPQLQLMIDDAVILKIQHLVEACDGVMYSDDDVSHGDLF